MPADSITIDCECGRTHEIEGNNGRLECDCGCTYAVTVTELKPLLED